MAEQGKPFGAELRRMRISAGLSLAELAKRIHYSKGYLSRVETGDKRASIELARQCDVGLGAEGALAALLSRNPSSARTCDHATVRVGDWMLEDGPEDAELILRARPEPATQVLSVAAGDELTVDSFRTSFAQSVRMGELHSGSLVLPTVVAHANTLWSLTREAPAATRGALGLLAALNATYAGWLALETGDDHAALQWSHTAVRIARIAGNPDLLAYTLLREAQVAIFRDDPAHTLALAAQVGRISGVSAHFSGVAAHREAQGYALAGDYNRCRLALDRSTMLLLGVGSAPTLGGAVLPPMAGGGSQIGGVIAGWCLYALGRPREAAEILDREVARIDVTHRRASTRFGARRVLAYAEAGEVEHACVLAHELLDVAEIVDSATTRLELRRLARTLSRWHSHPPVRELGIRLTAALQRPHL